MAPPATFTALLLVLALVPGWFHLHLIERVRPASRATGLNQLLEVVAVGVATTGVSVAATVLVPHRVVPFALDINAWATTGNAYLRWHLQAAVWSLVLTFALALAMAYLLYRVRARGSLEEFKANDSVWMHAIGQRPVGTVPWITLGLSDDSVVEGSLLAYTTDEDAEKRDIALKRPIWITPPNQSAAIELANLDRVVVPESQIKHITVIHTPAKPQQCRTRWYAPADWWCRFQAWRRTRKPPPT